MSTLSANRLAARPMPCLVAINKVEDFIVHTTGSGTNATTELTLDVIVNNCGNRTVELGLWRTADLIGGLFPPPPPTKPVSKQSFKLVEGRQTLTFHLPASTNADLHGIQAQSIVVVLYYAPQPFVIFSDSFKLDDQPNKCDQGKGLNPLFVGAAPTYYGDRAFAPAHYKGWSRLFQYQQFTLLERIIISAVAGSEGYMDAVQSNDSEVVSLGCIQKTLPNEVYSKTGKIESSDGELAQQLWLFKQSEPVRFACLLQTPTAGWDVTNPSGTTYRLQYTDTDPDTGTQVTYKRGPKTASNNLIALKALIRRIHKDAPKVKGQRGRHNRILDSLVRLGRDEAFQERQLLDARDRLRSKLNAHPYNRDTSKPDGEKYFTDNPAYTFNFPVGAYIRSDVGRAFLLNQDVNRPNQTLYYIGSALEEFFAIDWLKLGLPKPLPTDDPTNWSTSPDPAPTHGPITIRERYERELIRLYAESLYDRIDVYIYNGTTKSYHTGVTINRYTSQREYFTSIGRNVAWLPVNPRPARTDPSK